MSPQTEINNDTNDLILTYGGVRVIDENGNILKNFFPYPNDSVEFGRLLHSYNINQQTVMINLFEEPVEFIESKQYAPDNPLFMGIIGRHESRCKILNEHIVDYRMHTNNMSKGLLNIRYREGLDTLFDLKEKFPDHSKNYRKEFFFAILKKTIQIFLVKIYSFIKK